MVLTILFLNIWYPFIMECNLYMENFLLWRFTWCMNTVTAFVILVNCLSVYTGYSNRISMVLYIFVAGGYGPVFDFNICIYTSSGY